MEVAPSGLAINAKPMLNLSHSAHFPMPAPEGEWAQDSHQLVCPLSPAGHGYGNSVASACGFGV